MLKTIDVDQLRPGMHVQRLLGSWLKHPFWRTAFVAGDEDIARLQASIVRQVVIDTALGPDIEDADAGPCAADDDPPAPADAPDPAPAAPAVLTRGPTAALAAEMEQAQRIVHDGRGLVSSLFHQARLGRIASAEAALPLAQAINASIARHPAALSSVARIKSADDYTYMHSIAVGALMAMLSRQLGMDEDQALDATLGGVLHDLGKAAIPLEILNKPGRLDEREYDLVKTHPEHGEQMLRGAGMEHRPVLEIALHHHEKIDGSGYPHGLSGEAITPLARMGAICDVYDAVTSHRPYKNAWDPGEALRRMASWDGHFDPALFKAFVRGLGIYPIGSLVRLESERLAVVIEQHPEQLLTPRVCVFFSARTRQHILVQDIDLAAPGNHDRIVQAESPEPWGFRDLDKLWRR